MKWFFSGFVFVILGLLTWGGIYVYDKGFSRSWRKALSDEFRRHGLEISVRRVSLDPLQGLIAKDVRIFDGSEQGELLAEVSQIGLDVNIPNLIERRNFLNSADLRDATLSIPVDPRKKNGPRLKISGLRAKIFFPPNQIRLSYLEFEAEGMRFTATGMILVPDGFRPPLNDGKEEMNPAEWLEKFLAELRLAEFPEGPVHVSLEFSGSAGNWEDIAITQFLIESGPVIHPRFSLRSAYLEAAMESGRLVVRRCVLEDIRGGEFFATALFTIPLGPGSFQIRSELNVPEVFSTLLAERLPDWVVECTDSPRFELIGEWRPENEHSLKLLGSVDLGRFSVRGVPFLSLTGQFGTDGGRVLLRDLLLTHESGALNGQVLLGPGAVRARMVSTLNPEAFAPFLDTYAAAFLSEWDFESSPVISLELEGPSFSFDDISAEGRIELLKASFRGTDLDYATADVRVEDRSATYSNILLKRREGQATGTFIYDFGLREARLKDLRMNLNPSEVIVWVDPKMVKDVLPYRFFAPPNLQLDGRVKFETAEGTELIVQLDAPGGLAYEFLGKDLPVGRTTSTLEFRGRKLSIQDLNAELFGGLLTATAKISLDENQPGHQAAISAEKLDFESVTDLYFAYDESAGRLSGRFEFTGRAGDPAEITGRGEGVVVDGDVFAIPVLGPLSGVLSTLLPGAGYSKAREAKATFEVRSGVIETSDFEVIGNGFSMIGGGKLFFIEDRMDFDIRINAQGLPGALLFPVSKIFEYTSQDSMSNPVWKPKLLSR